MVTRATTLSGLFPSGEGPQVSLRDRATVASQRASVITERTAKKLAAGGAIARDYMSSLSADAWKELQNWAAFRQPNYWYILFNAIQIVTCLAVLVIGFACVNEARDDLSANVASKLMDTTDASTVTPCGYPAPDMLHLLRLQGAYEHQFGLPQLIEPDYKRWNLRVLGSMCSTDPYWTTTGNDGVRDAATDEKARMLHGLYGISGSLKTGAYTADAAGLLALETKMLNDMCNEEGNRTYSSRLHTSFGDPLTRIARAYLAAAPAFRAYQVSKTNPIFNGGTCLGDIDPFGYTTSASGATESTCSNADYIDVVLQRAGSIHNSARLAGILENTPGNTALWHAPGSNTFVAGPLEMLYALYALSVINHYDKTANGGQCFKNSDASTAVELCAAQYLPGDFDGYTLPGLTNPALTIYGSTVLDVNYYRMSDAEAVDKYSCSATTISDIVLTTSELANVPSPPAPPPFVSHRGAQARFAGIVTSGSTDASAVRQHVISSCAATMQYGLFDQERLFGVPDVLNEFQHDNRPDASLHFLGGITAQSYYLGPLEEADLAFQRPVDRLELYLAYRLASLALWGSLIASVTGFFIGRSGVPLVVAALSLVFGIKQKNGVRATIVQPSARSIFQDAFTILAAVAAFVGAYYTIFVDPSAQSYYPTTPKCDDYILGKDYAHSAGGAYVTSWGKRRFNRYSETQIGIVLIFMALVPVIYTFTKVFTESSAKAQKANRIGMTIFDTSVNSVFLIAAGTIVGGQVYNCINTGENWMAAARVSPFDTSALNDALGRDCLAVVLMSFWVGLALSVNRASWVMNKVSAVIYRVAFFGGCILTIWLNQISYLALMPDEYADAFAYPSKDDQRRNAQIISLAGTGLFTGAVMVEFYVLQKEINKTTDKGASQAITVTANKNLVNSAGAYSDSPFSIVRSIAPGEDGFFKMATVHIDPRARARTGIAPAANAANAAVAALTRIPLPSAQRSAPIGTRSRGQYAPMQSTTSMPHINLSH